MKIKTIGALFVSILFSAAAWSAPLSLEGMGMIKQWTDFENQAGEMPGFVWGNSDTLGADRVGLYVEFDDGSTGSLTYSGVSGAWNTNNTGIFGSPGLGYDTATGFFTAVGGLHFLYNNDPTTTFPEALPMAWFSNVIPNSNNFDLDYNETSGSNFRASTTGWVSATITTYSSAYSANVPEPSALMLMALGLMGFRVSQIRKV